MRNIIILFSLVIFFVIYHKGHQQIRNDLSKPAAEREVYYRIGTIDPRFNLSESEARSLVLEAAKVWEAPLGHQFFFYHPKAAFTINFIYDQRQQTTNERQQAQRVLDDGQGRNQAAKDDFQQKKSELTSEYQRHNDELAALNERISQHQHMVALINARGGATPMERQSMQMESDQLDRDVAEFNQKGTNLNVEQVNLRHQGEVIQSQVDDYNQKAQNYNQKFVGHPFEAGLYKGDAINIYEYGDKDELRLILAHELGHSLGLKHSRDPHALMYPMMGEQDLANFKLTQADIDLLYGRANPY